MKKRINHSDSGLLFAGNLFLIVGASIYVILLICQGRSSTINFDSCEHAGGLFLVFGEWTIRKAMKARLSFPIFAFVAMMAVVLGARWLGSLLALGPWHGVSLNHI